MLTMGWSDGHTFLPLDFALLSSRNAQINGMNEKIDKRTSGYKRRQEALQSAPQVIASMLDRALEAGATASYVLMDSWFTHAPLISEVVRRGLDVIGMVKNDNKRFLVQGRKLSLKELYAVAPRVDSKKRHILRSIRTELACGIPVLVVFVRHRTNKNEWLAILTTDLTLTVEEVIRIYAIRWDIEVFFKCTKSALRLQKSFKDDLTICSSVIQPLSSHVTSYWHGGIGKARTRARLVAYFICCATKSVRWIGRSPCNNCSI